MTHSDECPQGEDDESQCVGGKCECPDPNEKFCCDPGAEVDECNGHCRPTAECDAEPCKVAEDCTGPVDSRCGGTRCDRGICRLEIVIQFPSQFVGDCKEMVCDTTGRVVPREYATDVFNDVNECTLDTCTGSESANVPLPAGPSSSCRPCDLDKICHAHDDCDSGVCAHGQCQAPSCRDGAQNRFETDIDCGGGECMPCPLYIINTGADERP